MPKERLVRAPRLRAIFNVETNFLPNVDYAHCFANGIHVLSPSAAFALPVAEAALGMAIDLARGITVADRAFRAGVERYGLEGNVESFQFSGSRSEEHTSELQSLMRTSYAVFCLKKKTNTTQN